ERPCPGSGRGPRRPLQDPERRAGRVVARELAGSDGPVRRRSNGDLPTEGFLELLLRYASRQKRGRGLWGKGQDGRLDADTTGPSVEHEIHPVAQLVDHVLDGT